MVAIINGPHPHWNRAKLEQFLKSLATTEDGATTQWAKGKAQQMLASRCPRCNEQKPSNCRCPTQPR